MRLLKHIQKQLGHMIGMAVVCCVIGAFILNNYPTRSSGATVILSTAEEAAYESTSFKSASTVHRSHADRSSNCHFSIKNRTTVKLLMQKASPGILSLAQLQSIEGTVSNTPANYSIVALPGYYLFLFRYALF